MAIDGLRFLYLCRHFVALLNLLMNYKTNPVFGFIVVEGKICVACEKNGKDREKGVGRQTRTKNKKKKEEKRRKRDPDTIPNPDETSL